MLALITTTEGLPLGYELFPGNSYEGNTLISVIEEVEKNYNLSETYLVADRAMFTKNNLEKLKEKNVKFIVAAKLKTMKKDLKERILSDIEKAKRVNNTLNNWTNEYIVEGKRLIVSYSRKRADKDQKDRERLLDRIKKRMKNGKVVIADLINNSGTKKYLKIEKKGAKEATLNQNKIDLEQRWDGLHGVITNHRDDMCAADILEKYKGLWRIEEAFRINKNDLKMRPIYHWTPRRIRAHILICFVAYTLVAFVRKKLHDNKVNISFEEAREELNRLQLSLIIDKKTKQKFLLPSKLTDLQIKIYSAFGIKLSEAPTII